MQSMVRAPGPEPAAESGWPSTAGERRWVLVFALLLLALTTLPYLLGFAMQGEALRFTGFVFGVEDGNSYLAKMLSGAYGAWLFRTPYTVFPQRGVLMYLPYLLLGKLGGLPGLHEQLVGLYQAFRWLAGVLLALAAYDFLALFVRQVRLRRLALAVVLLGGGLGWLWMLSGGRGGLSELPLDFYSPETFGFLAFYGLPHVALGRALLLWGLVIYLVNGRLEAGGRPPWRSVILLNLAWLGAGLCQPLAAALLGGVLGLHLLVQTLRCALCRLDVGWQALGRALRFAAAGFVLPGAWAAVSAASYLTDPYLQTWGQQNVLLSPPISQYVLAYLLLAPLAAAGAVLLVREDAWRGWLPAAWALALPVLAYAPTNLQRRLPDGGWVALAALAFAALEGLQHWARQAEEKDGGGAGWRTRTAWAAPLALLVLVLPSTLLLIAGGLQAAGQQVAPAFLPTDQVRIFEYLAQDARPGDAALAAFHTSNALPAWVPLRVVTGHGPESANFAIAQSMVEEFYQPGTPDARRRAMLQVFRARYVLWGPEERQLGSWDPHQASFLVPLEREGEYEVFEALR